MTPPDQEVVDYLLQLEEIDGNSIHLRVSGQHITNGVLLKYPLLITLTHRETPSTVVLEAKLCRIHTGEPTRQVKITMKSPLPGFLNLKEWGTFYTKRYNKEPLRCFKCQRFGDHKNSCTLPDRCGVCAGPHETDQCIQKHKTDRKRLQSARIATKFTTPGTGTVALGKSSSMLKRQHN